MTQVQAKVGAGLSFINARLLGNQLSTLRIVGSQIAAVASDPQPGDRIVDLQGDRLFPGLINAHDHLQLNSLSRPQFGKRYHHVRDWISEIDARRRSDSEFEAGVAVALDERLLIGGIKNLLSGVTTVAHHDPFYPFLSDPEYPTQVVRDYGWSHSLYIDGERQLTSSYRNTPSTWPWIVHAAEGLDDEAADEFERLDTLGCLGPNTLVVHGIALGRSQRSRLQQAGAGLIWCPSSNLNLFDKTAQVADLMEHGRVALGTDSRLSGARDLLEELRIAAEVGKIDEQALEMMVTRDGARLLRLLDRGVLRTGARADILILPAGSSLSSASRSDVRLVLIDGIVRYGDEDCANSVAPGSHWSTIRVDGKPKIMDSGIAARLRQSTASEVGLELAKVTWRAA